MTSVDTARSAAVLERLRMRFEQAAERAAVGDSEVAAGLLHTEGGQEQAMTTCVCASDGSRPGGGEITN